MSNEISSPFSPSCIADLSSYLSPLWSPLDFDENPEDLNPLDERARIAPQFVIERIAEQFHVQAAQFFDLQDSSVALPRAISVYILRNDLHFSNSEITSFLGMNDEGITETIKRIKGKIDGKNLTIIGSLNQWKKSFSMQQDQLALNQDSEEPLCQISGPAGCIESRLMGNKRKISSSTSIEPANKKTKIDPHFVIEKIAEQFRVLPAQLLQSQDSSVALPRAISVYILKNDLHFSNSEITGFLGMNDEGITEVIKRIEGKIAGKNLTIIGSLNQWKKSLSIHQGQLTPNPNSGKLPLSEKAKTKPQFVIEKIAEQFHVQPAQLLQLEDLSVTLPREISIYVLYERLDFSDLRIASFFGAKVHEILSAVRWIRNRIKEKNQVVVDSLHRWEEVQNSFEQANSLQIEIESEEEDNGSSAFSAQRELERKEKAAKYERSYKPAYYSRLRADVAKAALPNATPEEKERGEKSETILHRSKYNRTRRKAAITKASLPNATLDEVKAGKRAKEKLEHFRQINRRASGKVRSAMPNAAPETPQVVQRTRRKPNKRSSRQAACGIISTKELMERSASGDRVSSSDSIELAAKSEVLLQQSLSSPVFDARNCPLTAPPFPQSTMGFDSPFQEASHPLLSASSEVAISNSPLITSEEYASMRTNFPSDFEDFEDWQSSLFIDWDV